MKEYLEFGKKHPIATLIMAGLALSVAFLLYLLLQKDISRIDASVKHIDMVLTNHVSETDKKIDRLENLFRGEIKEIRAGQDKLESELRAGQDKLESELRAGQDKLEQKLDILIEHIIKNP